MFGYKFIYNTISIHKACIFQLLLRKRRHYFWKNMDSINLNPPNLVRGMTELDRNKFKKIIKTPKLKILESNSNKILPLLKKYLLKMERFRPVQILNANDSNNSREPMKVVYLHPLAVKSFDCLPEEIKKFDINVNNFYYDDLELTYDNWRADELLKFILPEDQESLTSYSRIGHIVHINLRDHLLPYKQIIGEILKDKISGCRTVVNKSSNITNEYRNFELELIYGEPDYQAEVKENGIVFMFDFSKVYWNPRLSTEHERIVKIVKPFDVLYDVFAGVGPFSVPAAKKNCRVLANDLNPESYKYLNKNILRNKCGNHIKTFNKDGRDFILNEIRNDLMMLWQNVDNEKNSFKIHITMNLPAIAVEFLDAFVGLYKNEKNLNDIQNFPIVHLYSFAKGENTKEIVKNLVEKNLSSKLDDNLIGIYFVRNVAPNKDMYRVSFNLTKEILFRETKKRSHLDLESNESSSKKMCC